MTKKYFIIFLASAFATVTGCMEDWKKLSFGIIQAQAKKDTRHNHQKEAIEKMNFFLAHKTQHENVWRTIQDIQKEIQERGVTITITSIRDLPEDSYVFVHKRFRECTAAELQQLQTKIANLPVVKRKMVISQ